MKMGNKKQVVKSMQTTLEVLLLQVSPGHNFTDYYHKMQEYVLEKTNE